MFVIYAVLTLALVEVNGYGVREMSMVDVGFAEINQELSEPIDSLFENFKHAHGKQYANASEESQRRAIFVDNVEYINAHNNLYLSGKTSYYMGVNQFSDMTYNEWRSLFTTQSIDDVTTRNDSIFLTPDNFEAPSSVNWAQRGYVTPVKNQQRCGSCWAFSATGAIEGQHFRKYHRLVSLSEQQLLDCSGYGCRGGYPTKAMFYVRDVGGIASEQAYPYKARSERCHFRRSMAVAHVKGVMQVRQSERDLMNVLASQGPISVSIVVNKNFMQYRGGIFYDPSCSRARDGHAVLVVGYGSSPREYWLVKNSWGTRWGEHGYIRMARNKGNMCRIANAAVFPTM
ncbi:procathepsin L-like [Mya arenaria]|uniref:procathepsin L-like n=1 Tax=Mya arenaria TaxID=6604 RepID=UPI0022E4FFC8|nr:procathepsin L-like [Mya arenaria]